MRLLIDEIKNVLVFGVGQQSGEGAERLRKVAVEGEDFLCALMIVGGQPELADAVYTVRAAGGFAGSLDGRKEQGHQHADDRDDCQEFDEREGREPALAHGRCTHGNLRMAQNRQLDG